MSSDKIAPPQDHGGVMMDESYEIWKHNVGPGWRLLVRVLCQLVDNTEDSSVLQIKEKFGGLRIYIYSPSVELHRIAFLVEQLSRRICERCGMDGSVDNNHYWIKTLCPTCIELRQADEAVYHKGFR